MQQWYYGIADAHGIESFVPDLGDQIMDLFMSKEDNKARTSQQFAMCLRAQANQQRHSVVYRALVEDEDSNVIEKLIAESKYVDALIRLKSCAKDVLMGTYGTTVRAAEKNWSMIPNPSLDPYHQDDKK